MPHVCGYLQKPEEGIRSPGLELLPAVNCSARILGSKLRSSGEGSSSLTCVSLSNFHYITLKVLFLCLVERSNHFNYPAAKAVISATKLLDGVWLTVFWFFFFSISDKMFAQPCMGK